MPALLVKDSFPLFFQVVFLLSLVVPQTEACPTSLPGRGFQAQSQPIRIIFQELFKMLESEGSPFELVAIEGYATLNLPGAMLWKEPIWRWG